MLEIREMRPEDLERVAEIEKKIFYSLFVDTHYQLKFYHTFLSPMFIIYREQMFVNSF